MNWDRDRPTIFRGLFSFFGPRIMRLRFTLIALMTLHGAHVHSERILVTVTTTINSPSHLLGLSMIAGELTKRGHDVVLLTSEAKGTEGFEDGTISSSLLYRVDYTREDLKTKMEIFNNVASSKGMFDFLKRFSALQRLMAEGCVHLWKDDSILESLREGSFDLILSFPFNPCDSLTSASLDVPRVVYTPTIRMPTFHESMMGMSAPSSYVPYPPFTTFTDQMTFPQRLKNLVIPVMWTLKDYIANSPFRKIKLEHNIAPDKSIDHLQSQALLWLCNTDLSIDFARPVSPNWIPVGGIAAKPAGKLPKDIEDFVQGSGEAGVILFSLGSVVKGSFQDHITDVLPSVFGKLPQRVLWKHDTKISTPVSDNTKVVSWLPQNDLLGHPKTRLLIYHGGSNGVQEGIYHGIPMVIIPLFGDQFAHAARIQKKGIGLMLDKTNVTEETITKVILEVLHNPKFKERALHFSKIHHDCPMTPVERAVYWIEHVMKFGGDHLRPRSADMNVIELYMIDVAAFLVGVFFVMLYIDYLLLRACYHRCSKTTVTKPKCD